MGDGEWGKWRRRVRRITHVALPTVLPRQKKTPNLGGVGLAAVAGTAGCMCGARTGVPIRTGRFLVFSWLLLHAATSRRAWLLSRCAFMAHTWTLPVASVAKKKDKQASGRSHARSMLCIFFFACVLFFLPLQRTARVEPPILAPALQNTRTHTHTHTKHIQKNHINSSQ